MTGITSVQDEPAPIPFSLV